MTGKGDNRRREVARYAYTDHHGTLLFHQVRFHPKDFRPQMADGTWGLTCQRVLYNLPLVLQAKAREWDIWLVEGEKDADLLTGLNQAATTVGPATAWSATDTTPLHGAWRVIIVPDHDSAGNAFISTAASSLFPHVRLIQVVDWTNLVGEYVRKGFDVSDYFDEDPDASIIKLRQASYLWKYPRRRPKRRGPRSPRRRSTRRQPAGLPYAIEDIVYATHGRMNQHGRAVTWCPSHDDERSGNPGLSLTAIDDEHTLAYCHSGCEFPDIAEAVRTLMGGE